MQLVMLVVLAAGLSQAFCQETHRSKEFDFLIFTQLWPESDCIKWKERESENTCNLPQNKYEWTVHGIWPTRDGEIGPGYCKHIPFNHSLLDPIMDDLNRLWTNVHKNSDKYGFWKHEWEKHGTCAIQIPELDNELKYFSKGLEWNKKYPIGIFLAENNIFPGKMYDFETIYQTIANATQSVPSIQCQYDKSSGKTVISQVELCFNKNLTLMSCAEVHGGVNQHCPEHEKKIYYPEKEKVILWSFGEKIVLIVIIVLGFCVYLGKLACDQFCQRDEDGYLLGNGN